MVMFPRMLGVAVAPDSTATSEVIRATRRRRSTGFRAPVRSPLRVSSAKVAFEPVAVRGDLHLAMAAPTVPILRCPRHAGPRRTSCNFPPKTNAKQRVEKVSFGALPISKPEFRRIVVSPGCSPTCRGTSSRCSSHRFRSGFRAGSRGPRPGFRCAGRGRKSTRCPSGR